MQVEFIRGQDEVELMEIRGMHLPCAESRKIVATLLCMSHRARVRRVADVVVFRAGGIELDRESGLLGLDAEHGLSRRGTADVAHADEQYSAGLSGLGHGLDLAAEALVIV